MINTTFETSSPLIKDRIHAIDTFRGFSILIMVIFNYAMEVKTLPAWMKHSTDIGMTFPDLGTTVFVFAIGLTYGLSFRRRMVKDGFSATIGHFIRRYLAILGLGAIIAAGETMLGFSQYAVSWGVLQAIGCAGLLTMLVILLPPWTRLLIGVGLLAAYQFCLDTFWRDLVLRSTHGGLLGALSWTSILIIATFFGDLYLKESRRKWFPFAATLTLAAGLALALVVPVSKPRVSASYDLITLGFSGIVFSIFYLTRFKLNFFAAWGKNPLLLYTLSYLLIGIFVVPGVPWWHSQAPLWLVGLQALFIVAALGVLAIHWQKRDFIFSM
jgi:predicted acyltransferase